MREGGCTNVKVKWNCISPWLCMPGSERRRRRGVKHLGTSRRVLRCAAGDEFGIVVLK